MIEVRNIHKQFGDKDVLRGVDLTVRDGETLVIIGRSGCGKSVLLKHITALLEPDEGDIKIDGRSMFSMTPMSRTGSVLNWGCCFRGRLSLIVDRPGKMSGSHFMNIRGFPRKRLK